MWRPVNLICESRTAKILGILLPAAGVLMLVLLMFQLHSIEIVAGNMLIVLGSAGAMIGLEGVQGSRGKWIRALVVGVILALGAYISTDGIEERQQYFSDRDALVSFNIERKLNGMILEFVSLAHQTYTTAIVTRDHELAKAVNKYILSGEMLASDLGELEQLNRGLFRKSDWAKNKIREIFDKEGAFDRFRGADREVESLIASEYQWSVRDIWNRLDRSMFDEAESLVGFVETLPPEDQKAFLNWYRSVTQKDRQEAGPQKSEPNQ